MGPKLESKPRITLNGKVLSPEELARRRLEQKRTYTTCATYDSCRFAREDSSICRDTPDECPVLKKTISGLYKAIIYRPK